MGRNEYLAALTNVRLSVIYPGTRPSRGTLVADFLRGHQDSAGYLAALAQRADDYSPFDLIVCDGLHFMGMESRSKPVHSIVPGIGAVSNADFDTPWPKLVRLKAGLQAHWRAPESP